MKIEPHSLFKSHYKRPELISVFLLLLVCWAICLKYRLLSTLNIHWDEFHFLALVYDYLRGDLSQKLQTFYVHLFTWLPAVSPNEINQVFVARKVMFLFSLGSSLSIWFIGRRLMNSSGALFAILCMLSFSYHLQYGASFRYDPLLVFVFLWSVAILVVGEHDWIPVVWAGILVALCFLISIKSIFFIPTWIIIFLLRNFVKEQKSANNWKLVSRDALLFSISVVSALLLFTTLHWISLAKVVEVSAATSSFAFLNRAGMTMFTWNNYFPQMLSLAQSFRWDNMFWGLLIIGLSITVGEIIFLSGRRRFQKVMLLSLALPLSSLLIYRNSYPYYYVCLIPPASLLAGVPVAKITSRFSKRPVVTLLLVTILTTPVLWKLHQWFKYNSADQTIAQRELVKTVHRLFPDPTPFIDRCSMISSYPKVGLFMTSWNIGKYQQAGQPIMANLLSKRQPKFIIDNVGGLSLSKPWDKSGDWEHRLLQADFKTLQDNYIHHWGLLWVAGKQFPHITQKENENFAIMIEGIYQLEAETTISLDGVVYKPGQSLFLKQGMHKVTALQQDTKLILRWGNLEKPRQKASAQRLFTGFSYNTGE